MNSAQPRSLVWFRRDLRVRDNIALAQACQTQDQEVLGIYVVTPKQWKRHDDAEAKVAFTRECLGELSTALSALNIPLVIETCDEFAQVPNVIKATCEKYHVDQLFYNLEYEVNERNRDREVTAAVQEIGVRVHPCHDRVVIPPKEIQTKQGAFYSVFTPYRKVWDRQLIENADYSLVRKAPRKRKRLPAGIRSTPVPRSIEGFRDPGFWHENFPAGEQAALKKLKSFSKRIANYQPDRDHPAIGDGTSGLSPYLVAGTVSPRQCLAMVHNAGSTVSSSDGASVWISELTWRDFYSHVLVGFPRVSKHLPFKLATNQLDWRTDAGDFEAWCQGKTGFPIVDAGMRQLNATGWMHNRLRMVTAMFLTKNLFIDWRMGERYFMQNLIDGDLAANNGGWQWSASTGTDAVPYFRIFNPFSQSKRFDKEGSFIKAMCPELDPVPAAALHDPKKLTAEIEKRGIDYPSFVVDYKMSRERALNAFKA